MDTDVSKEISKTVFEGHNVLILGWPGTGKTELIKRLSGALIASGKIVQMSASTGLASTLLPRGTTVHKFLGLMDGRFSEKELVDSVLLNEDNRHIKEKIRSTDVLFVDECSMVSASIFSKVEYLCRKVRGNDIPFGGIQMIFSGDFYQLRPVAHQDYGDDGEYMFLAETFEKVIPHHFVLKEVYRQKQDDLAAAVKQICCGDISQDAKDLIANLNRPLPAGPAAVILYGLRREVEKCNSDNLLDMPGQMKSYPAEDRGDVERWLQCPAAEVIHLKVDAPAMLTVNLSETLVNGLRCRIVTLHEKDVTVFFPTLQQIVRLSPYTFTKYSRAEGRNIASRKQIPVMLAFALTVHRAQGLTLDRVIVDCKNMRQPGQVGVAIGRGSNKAGLMVVNFRPENIPQHAEDVQNFYRKQSSPVLRDLACCRSELGIDDYAHKVVDDTMSSLDDDDLLSEQELDLADIEIIESLEKSDEATEAGSQPSNVIVDDIQLIIEKGFYLEPKTDRQKAQTENMKYLRGHMSDTKIFADEIYGKLSHVFREILSDETKVENKHITACYKEVTQFMSSEQYKVCVRRLFQAPLPSSEQYRAAFHVTECLREKVLEDAVKHIKETEKDAATEREGKRYEMSETGRGKLRYIAGWSVARLKYQKQQVVRRNLYNQKRKEIADRADREDQILQELVETEYHLFKTSDDKESLLYIKEKQNIRGSLCNISDSAFQFFLYLDAKVRSLETTENVNIHGPDFYTFITDSITGNQELIKKWNDLFPSDLEHDVIISVFTEIINKYICMSSAQFRRQYMRTVKTKKQLAHRTQIRLAEKSHKSQAQPTRELRFNILQVYTDTSLNKIDTHKRLQGEIRKKPKFFSSKDFTKAGLETLSKAYGISSKRKTKAEIGSDLAETILQIESIPHPEELQDPEETSQAPAGAQSMAQEGASNVSGPSTYLSSVAESGESSEPPSKSLKMSGRRSTAPSSQERKVPGSSIPYPCGLCGENCPDNCVACDKCNKWFHMDCLGYTGEESDLEEEEWTCRKCS